MQTLVGQYVNSGGRCLCDSPVRAANMIRVVDEPGELDARICTCTRFLLVHRG
jgi:hypothetical protein